MTDFFLATTHALNHANGVCENCGMRFGRGFVGFDGVVAHDGVAIWSMDADQRDLVTHLQGSSGRTEFRPCWHDPELAQAYREALTANHGRTF